MVKRLSLTTITNPEAALQEKIFKVDQLTALFILLNGRGPKMFHTAIVR